MASTFVQSKVFNAIGLFCLMVLLWQKVEATDFTVSWRVPSDAQSFNQWAEANRFQIGDSLVFNYPAEQDSVLQVSKDDYTNCTTQSPIIKFSNGHTIFRFQKSGPHYFISGNLNNCLQNEKLHVVVLANRSNSTTTLPPPPSAAPEIAPASNQPGSPTPSPSTRTESTPSPAPESSQTPIATPPPPESTEIINPSPAPFAEVSPALAPPTNSSPTPISEPPPTSHTSSIIPNCIGSIGALAAALIVAF